jgi:hypothetical protein
MIRGSCGRHSDTPAGRLAAFFNAHPMAFHYSIWSLLLINTKTGKQRHEDAALFACCHCDFLREFAGFARISDYVSFYN